MKSAAPSRRDRVRQMLADLRMPGSLEDPMRSSKASTAPR
jgi:hypothetical protein